MPLASSPGSSKSKAARLHAVASVERSASLPRKQLEARVATLLRAFWRSVPDRGIKYAQARLVAGLTPVLARAAAQSAAAALALWTEPSKKFPRTKAVTKRGIGDWLDENSGSTIDGWMKRWGQKRALERARSISETSKKLAAKVLRQVTATLAADAGGGLPGQNAIAAAFLASGADMPDWRARTIARTEIHNAMTEVDREIAGKISEDVGPLVKVWAATNDERTRPDHEAADGQSRDADESFSIGGVPMDGPGDIDAPPEQTVNCRCTILWEPKGGWD
jgi:hypothetical protein